MIKFLVYGYFPRTVILFQDYISSDDSEQSVNGEKKESIVTTPPANPQAEHLYSI